MTIHPELKGRGDRQGLQGHKVSRVQLDRQDRQARQDLRVRLEQLEQLVRPVLRGKMVRLAHRVQPANQQPFLIIKRQPTHNLPRRNPDI